MALDRVTLGQRLRDARRNKGTSQEQAAERLEIPRTAMVQIEQGSRSVSSLELFKLVDLYEVQFADLLADNSRSNESPLQLLFRIAPGLEEDPETKECVTRCLELCEAGVELEQMIRLKINTPPAAYPLSPPRNKKEAMEQGFNVADAERRRLGLGNNRIPDMAELISEQGIWATGAHLPNAISGFCMKHPSVGVCIVVNYSHPISRKRFSYAHEYGHAIMDRDDSVNITEKDNASELVETRANCFAASFLAPESGIWDVLHNIHKGQPSRETVSVFSEIAQAAIQTELRRTARSQEITYQDIAFIAHHFFISYQSAVYRLRSIGAINADKVDSLLSKEDDGNTYLEILGLDAINKKADRDDPADRELHSIVLRFASGAYQCNEISRGRFIDIMGIAGLDAKEQRQFLEMTMSLQKFD